MPKASFLAEPDAPVPHSAIVGLSLIEVDSTCNVRLGEREYVEDEELFTSLKQDGLIEPLVVRPPMNGGSRYRLIAGRRRFREAIRAGLETVPVRVLDVDDSAARRIAFKENFQRKQFSPVDLGLLFQATCEAEQWDGADWSKRAAEYFGVSRATVTEHVKLVRKLKDEPDILAKVHAGELAASAGIELAKVEAGKRADRLAEAQRLADSEQKAKQKSSVTTNVVEGKEVTGTPPAEKSSSEPLPGKNKAPTREAKPVKPAKVKKKHIQQAARGGKAENMPAMGTTALIDSLPYMQMPIPLVSLRSALLKYGKGNCSRAYVLKFWLAIATALQPQKTKAKSKVQGGGIPGAGLRGGLLASTKRKLPAKKARHETRLQKAMRGARRVTVQQLTKRAAKKTAKPKVKKKTVVKKKAKR